MKISNILLCFVALTTVFSCKNSEEPGKKGQLDFDLYKLWNKEDNRLLFVDFAKTGKYVSYVDSINPFSIGMEGKLVEFNGKPFSKIIFSGFMRTKSVLPQGGFVVDIRDGQGKTVSYNLAKVSDVVKEPNKWYDFNLVIDLKAEKVDKPENYIKAYGWTSNKEIIYFDDISVNFE